MSLMDCQDKCSQALFNKLLISINKGPKPMGRPADVTTGPGSVSNNRHLSAIILAQTVAIAKAFVNKKVYSEDEIEQMNMVFESAHVRKSSTDFNEIVSSSVWR